MADDQYFAIIADSLYGMSSYWERTQYGIRNFKYHFTVFNSANAQLFQIETTGNYLTNTGTKMAGALRGNGVWILGIIQWYEGLYNVGLIRAYDDQGNNTWSKEIRSVPNQQSIAMDKNGVVYELVTLGMTMARMYQQLSGQYQMGMRYGIMASQAVMVIMAFQL